MILAWKGRARAQPEVPVQVGGRLGLGGMADAPCGYVAAICSPGQVTLPMRPAPVAHADEAKRT